MFSSEKYRSHLHDEEHYSKKENNAHRYKPSSDFKAPSLSKSKELLEMANQVWKALHWKEIKSLKKLADDDIYIEIFEKEFNEVDFHGLKGAHSTQQKTENLQIMIDFLGNAIYEMDLSHIEPSEIIKGDFDHIQRFVKLLYEWSMTQTGISNYRPKRKIIEMANSGNMKTADTWGNVNSASLNKNDVIDFYKNARPEMKVEHVPHATSKFRILSSNDAHETSEITEIFRNSVKKPGTPTITSSLATSVNTTILGGVNANMNSHEDWNILNPSFQNDSSYEKSIEKGVIRNQVNWVRLV
jgi:hypothetical protein